jgi:phytoene/squalene synthetase
MPPPNKENVPVKPAVASAAAGAGAGAAALVVEDHRESVPDEITDEWLRENLPPLIAEMRELRMLKQQHVETLERFAALERTVRDLVAANKKTAEVPRGIV